MAQNLNTAKVFFKKVSNSFFEIESLESSNSMLKAELQQALKIIGKNPKTAKKRFVI